MQIQVLFFGRLKDLFGAASTTFDLPENSSVQYFLEHISLQTKQLQAWLPSLAVAVNQQFVQETHRLHDGDEVALLPPVSGGAPAQTRLQNEPILPEKLLAELKVGDDGAVVIFDGIVRNNTRGRRTLYLEYESYREMAEMQLQQLAERARAMFEIRDLRIIHRLGRLEIGETSVWSAVASAHRAAAFDACRWIIDTLKKTVPIWKKEFFEDGAVWADGEPFPPELNSQNSKESRN